MRLTMRWFGPDDDLTLQQIQEIGCIRGIVATLGHIPAGDVWPPQEIARLKQTIEEAGFNLDVVESVPVAEAIKLGLPEREGLIENYCETLRHLGRAGVRVVCYNFMPLLDWMRTDMEMKLADGSVVTGYRHTAMEQYDLSRGLEARVAWARGFSGEELRSALGQYADLDEERIFEHLVYFLQRVVPVALQAGVYLALHPDDPPWSIFGLPRIVRDAATIQRILDAVPDRHNGLTFCTGSLGALADNDLPAMVRQFADRIHFVHLRNVKVTGEKDFHEVAHPAAHGSVDLPAVVAALVDTGFTGPARPDHGRAIWGEQVRRTGYGLYDRALGAAYLQGLYEMYRYLAAGQAGQQPHRST